MLRSRPTNASRQRHDRANSHSCLDDVATRVRTRGRRPIQKSVHALLLCCSSMVSDQYSEDIVSQEAKSLIVSVNANQEQDAPPTKKKKIREEEVVDVMREKAEEKTNILSQAREEDEMDMPSPQKRPGKRSVGGQGAVSRQPLTAHPNPKQLGRRFTTASKRKTEKTKSGEDPSSSAEENEVPSQVILSNRSRGINLTGEQECDVVDWFQEHEIFYNKKLTDYRETGKKARLLEEKAAELSLHGECNLMLIMFSSYTDLCSN